MSGKRQRHQPRHGRAKGSNRVGIARYQPHDWPRWLEIADDRNDLPKSYADWLRDASAMAERLGRAGLEVVWVDVEPNSFQQWCRDREIANDAEARSRFAAERIGNLPAPD